MTFINCSLESSEEMSYIKINKSLASKIVEAVHEVCSCQINFIDNKGMIIASTDKSRISEFHEAGYAAIKEGIPIIVEFEEQYVGTKKGVNYPIIMDDNPIAVIGITGDPEEVAKFGFLATKVSEIFIREQKMNQQNESARQRINYFIRSYIYRELDNIEHLEQILPEFHLQKDSNISVLIVKLNNRYNPQNITLIEKKINRLFEDLHIRNHTYIYPNEFIGFVEEEECLNQQKVIEKFCDGIQDVLSIGVGSLEPLSKAYISYERAKLALKSERVHEKGYLFYDDLTIERILGTLKPLEKNDFLKRVLGELDSSEREILRFYFDKNMSLKETAAEFYIHINTLQYKLDRIARLTNLNPRIFKEAMVLYMALLLETM